MARTKKKTLPHRNLKKADLKKAGLKKAGLKKAGLKKTPPTRANQKVKAGESFQIRAGSEIWPLERDVLFRPDRFKYVRKLIEPEGCVFCKAGRQGPRFETLCVYQSAHSMIILNKFPYNSGHLLVVPRQHIGDFMQLSETQHQDLHQTLRLAIGALKQVYQPGGVNVGLNLGAVAGAGIPDHIHYHVIPRWAGDLNFFPLVAETKTVIESLEMTFDRLIAYFKSEK